MHEGEEYIRWVGFWGWRGFGMRAHPFGARRATTRSPSVFETVDPKSDTHLKGSIIYVCIICTRCNFLYPFCARSRLVQKNSGMSRKWKVCFVRAPWRKWKLCSVFYRNAESEGSDEIELINMWTEVKGDAIISYLISRVDICCHLKEKKHG